MGKITPCCSNKPSEDDHGTIEKHNKTRKQIQNGTCRFQITSPQKQTEASNNKFSLPEDLEREIQQTRTTTMGRASSNNSTKLTMSASMKRKRDASLKISDLTRTTMDHSQFPLANMRSTNSVCDRTSLMSSAAGQKQSTIIRIRASDLAKIDTRFWDKQFTEWQEGRRPKPGAHPDPQHKWNTHPEFYNYE